MLCLEHGTPLCPKCGSLGWGISRCCRAGQEGHTDPSAGPCCPSVPPRVAPRRVLVPEADAQERRRCPLSLDPPCLPSPSGLGPPGVLPVQPPPPPPKTLGAHRSSALETDNSGPPKCPKLNLLANRGGSVSEALAHPEGFGLWAYLPESEEGLRGPRSAALGKLGSGAPHSPFGHAASGRVTRLLL